MRRAALRSRMILGAAAAALLLSSGSALAAPGDVALMSRESSTGPSGNHASTEPYATADGLNVAYLSSATNLVGSTVSTTVPQAYVRSLEENANQLASVVNGFGGAPANAAVTDVSVSDDGNMVAFHSRATNLPGNSAGNDAVFVRDVPDGITSLVASNASEPSISGDGRYVAFMSHDDYDGATGPSAKIYVSDLQGEVGTYDLVSTDAGASPTTLVGQWPRLSADGRYVAFVGQPTGPAPYTGLQVLVRDRTAGTTTLASQPTGTGSTGEATAPVSEYPGFSRNGRFVTWSTSSSLSAADTNTKSDVYERDLLTNTTILASRADGAGGAVGDANSQTTTVSGDGRYVGFISRSTNFSAHDNTNGDNAYVRDVANGTLTWVHGTPTEVDGSAPQGVMAGVSLTGDGRFLFYDTNATILPGTETGSVSDVFRRELIAGTTPPPPPPVVAVADAPAVAEGGPGAGATATFAVTLSAASAQPVSVHYATANGTATTDDYTSVAGTLVIDPGQTTASIPVPITGDDAVEPDETFTLTLDTPANATLGRAVATATITNDDTAPPAPPAPAPETKDHTLLGRVVYRPAFAPGADSGTAKGLATSPYARTVTRVRLVDAEGHALRTVEIPKPDPRQWDPSIVDFQMDGLAACHGCSAVFDTPAPGGGDSVPVDFGGEAGQTAVELEAGRESAGGRVEGSIASPLAVSGTAFSVKVVLPGDKGAVLADSAKTTIQCGGTAGTPKGSSARFGVACPPATELRYRLSGLPRDGSAATVQLWQRGPKDAVLVDTQDITLGASGETEVPELQALDTVPSHAAGRTLYGKIATLAPYAPGAVTSGELVPDPKDRPDVQLLRGGKPVKKAKVTVSTGAMSKLGVRTAPGVAYSLDGLDACPKDCALELRTGPSEKRRFPVVIPDRSPSVTRADLHYPATGTTEFLEGTVTTLQRTNVRVKVTDAKGKVLADSATLPDPTCHSTGARCPAKPYLPVTGTAPYRLGGLPENTPVKVTLSVGGKDVDTKLVTTAPAGEVTVVDTLTAPLTAPPASGHVVTGTVVPARAFVAGGPAAAVDPKAIAGVRLVDAHGKVVAEGKVAKPGPGGKAARAAQSTARPTTGATAAAAPYVFDLRSGPCADCVLELVERGGAVGDRVAVTVPEAAPSVTAAELRDGELTAGRWVNVGLTTNGTPSFKDLRVTVTGSDGTVLADSAGPAFKLCATTKLCRAGTALGYRLGGVPNDADTVTVTVTLKGKKVASDTVRFAPGAPEASSALVFRVAAPAPKG